MSGTFFRRITNGGQYAQYFIKPENLDKFRAQLIWRSGNLGMLELDLIIGKWAKKNVKNFEYSDCLLYEAQVLKKETPELFSIFCGPNKDKFALEDLDIFVREIKLWAEEGQKWHEL